MKKLLFAIFALLTLHSYSQDCERLNFEEVNIGELHNQYLKEAFEHGSLKSREAAVEYFSQIKYDPRPLKLTRDEFNREMTSLNDSLALFGYDLRKWRDSRLSEEAYSYLIRVLDATNEEITSLDEFNKNLDEIQNQANTTLKCRELDIVYGSIVIAKSSAYLWAPESIGGYGLYDKVSGSVGYNSALNNWRSSVAAINSPYLDAQMNNRPYFAVSNVSHPNVRLLKWWQKALIGDISGCAQYFTGFGVALAVGWATPGANVAILGGAALAGGLASGCAMGGF